MSSLSYFVRSEVAACRLCETAQVFRLVPRADEKARTWSDDELARIRVVFQKLTALRVQNDTDAEDLVQEALLTMIAKRPEESLEKGLLVWGMAILRRKVGNYYRKSRRFVPFEEGDARCGGMGLAGWTASPVESRLHLSELNSLIRRILEEFSPKERLVLELHLEGYATREIVRHLYPERYQNIANRLYRGKKRLARELRRYGYPVPD